MTQEPSYLVTADHVRGAGPASGWYYQVDQFLDTDRGIEVRQVERAGPYESSEDAGRVGEERRLAIIGGAPAPLQGGPRYFMYEASIRLYEVKGGITAREPFVYDVAGGMTATNRTAAGIQATVELRAEVARCALYAEDKD